MKTCFVSLHWDVIILQVNERLCGVFSLFFVRFLVCVSGSLFLVELLVIMMLRLVGALCYWLYLGLSHIAVMSCLCLSSFYCRVP